MNVAEFLDQRRVPYRTLPHEETFDAQRMAQALHVPGGDVAKTVLLRADRGFTYVLAVVPAPRHIDLERVSQLLGGSRIELATETELVECCPDCEPGVIPPFGSLCGAKTIVDESLAEDEEIVFEARTHHEAIRMRFEDYRRLEQPLIGRITVPSM